MFLKACGRQNRRKRVDWVIEKGCGAIDSSHLFTLIRNRHQGGKTHVDENADRFSVHPPRPPESVCLAGPIAALTRSIRTASMQRRSFTTPTNALAFQKFSITHMLALKSQL
jgi:hypothetical protein